MNSKSLGKLIIVGGASLAFAACAGTDENAVADSAAAATATAADSAAGAVGSAMPGTMGAMTEANVFAALAAANAAEVEHSKVAVQKATNADVKAFAQMMIDEHTAMSKSGDELAVRLNVTPAPNDAVNELRDESTKDVNDLTAKTGADVDKEYIDEQIDMHQETLDLLDRLDDNATNADLKAMIETAKPKVQQHLDRAKQIKDALDKAT